MARKKTGPRQRKVDEPAPAVVIADPLPVERRCGNCDAYRPCPSGGGKGHCHKRAPAPVTILRDLTDPSPKQYAGVVVWPEVCEGDDCLEHVPAPARPTPPDPPASEVEQAAGWQSHNLDT